MSRDFENLEIYRRGYEKGKEELDYLKRHFKLTPLILPHSVEIRVLRQNGEEEKANALEHNDRFNAFMAKNTKYWERYDPHKEQSLSEFSHDALGQYIAAEKEEKSARR